MNATTIRADAIAPQPWRNGGGVTRELLAWPAPGDWRVRVSVAEIARDGPFSPWPGVERWFAVLDGAGVLLRFGAATERLTAESEPLRFDGASAPGCALIDGPTRDLNVMLRGTRGSLVRAPAGAAWSPPTPAAGLFALAPGRCVADGEAVELPALALRWFATAPTTVSFDAPSLRIAVEPLR